MADSQTQQFAFQKIYVKDLSFESPNSPQVFLEKWEPDINLHLRNKSTVLDDNTHEVILEVTVTAKLKEKTVFLVEAQMAGIFNIVGYTQSELDAWTGSICPQLLFPYVREVVSDLVVRGGFPQLLLSPINFDALYRQRLEQGETMQTGDSKH
jgi:preprotein translocase subunit SecB